MTHPMRVFKEAPWPRPERVRYCSNCIGIDEDGERFVGGWVTVLGLSCIHSGQQTLQDSPEAEQPKERKGFRPTKGAHVLYAIRTQKDAAFAGGTKKHFASVQKNWTAVFETCGVEASEVVLDGLDVPTVMQDYRRRLGGRPKLEKLAVIEARMYEALDIVWGREVKRAEIEWEEEEFEDAWNPKQAEVSLEDFKTETPDDPFKDLPPEPAKDPIDGKNDANEDAIEELDEPAVELYEPGPEVDEPEGEGHAKDEEVAGGPPEETPDAPEEQEEMKMAKAPTVKQLRQHWYNLTQGATDQAKRKQYAQRKNIFEKVHEALAFLDADLVEDIDVVATFAKYWKTAGKGRSMAAESLQRSNYKNAILNFLDPSTMAEPKGPRNSRPKNTPKKNATKTVAPKPPKPKKETPKVEIAETQSVVEKREEMAPAPYEPETQEIGFGFPPRKGGMVMRSLPMSGGKEAVLGLPEKMTRRDVQRTKAFLDLLIVEDDDVSPPPRPASKPSIRIPAGDMIADGIDALMALGYKPREARLRIKRAEQRTEDVQDLQALVKEALR